MSKSAFLIILITCLAIITRFYNLNWGAPFYFHPDERNIAFAVSQIIFPSQLNPHFFAYNSFPIYLVYFTGVLMNLISHIHFLNNSLPPLTTVSFEQAIIIGRMYSALLSFLLIPSLYYVGKKIFNPPTGVIAALLALLSVGFVQFAHFSTFEMWLTFIGLWYFYCCYQVAQTYRRSWSVAAGLLFGLLVAVKISSGILFFLLCIAIFYGAFTRKYHGKLRGLFLHGILASIASVSIFCITCPFVILDYPSFHNSISYESSVALGTLPVFYTGGFYSTIPILFQFLYIYPFLINPLLTMLFIPAFFFIVWQSSKYKQISSLLLVICYLLLLLSQAFLFVKWMRYMVPTLPFMYLMLALSLSEGQAFFKKTHRDVAYTSILVVILCVAVLFTGAFFKTVYIDPDTRLTALTFAQNHIPSSTPIMSEMYDLGITPFNRSFSAITLFNFYDLDNGNETYQSAITTLDTASVFIIPSQRVVRNRMLLPLKFPNGNRLYTDLFTNTLGYHKTYETPCDIWCTITYMGDPIYHVEETANVFDRPTLFIFEKD